MKKSFFLACLLPLMLLICTKCSKDPCSGTKCLNGGTCLSGKCACQTGFTGSNCEVARTLISMTITEIVVEQFPASNNGYYWDAGTTTSKYPDIYINLNIGTTSKPSQSSDIHYDVNSVPQAYPVGPFILNNLGGYYSIGMYDFDGGNTIDQFMGGIYFTPINYSSGFPESFLLENAAGTIKYLVYVTWNFA